MRRMHESRQGMLGPRHAPSEACSSVWISRLSGDCVMLRHVPACPGVRSSPTATRRRGCLESRDLVMGKKIASVNEILGEVNRTFGGADAAGRGAQPTILAPRSMRSPRSNARYSTCWANSAARRRPSVEARHAGGDAAFIQKKQPVQIDGGDLAGGTPGAARGSLPCFAPGRGVTFFETQTKLLQPAPDGYLAHRHPGLVTEPAFQLLQSQIRLRGNPGEQQLALLLVHRGLPPWSMHRSFHQPCLGVRRRSGVYSQRLGSQGAT